MDNVETMLERHIDAHHAACAREIHIFADIADQ